MDRNLEQILQPFRGNYIKEMRKRIGHAPLMTTACGVIIENRAGEILLQQRRDNGRWGLPGGAMELGEKYIDTVRREVREEAGIEIDSLRLFGVYSGEDKIIVYPNGDVCCVTNLIFITTGYRGSLLQETDEAIRHAFFARDDLPGEINGFDRRIVEDWKAGNQGVIID